MKRFKYNKKTTRLNLKNEEKNIFTAYKNEALPYWFDVCEYNYSLI